jgi:hypothetical protein
MGAAPLEEAGAAAGIMTSGRNEQRRGKTVKAIPSMEYRAALRRSEHGLNIADSMSEMSKSEVICDKVQDAGWPRLHGVEAS